MDKIKIYDVDAFVREKANMACHTFGQVAIFEGPKGVVVAEKEAVHDKLQTLDDTFQFSLTKIPRKGSIYLVPSAYADIKVRDIMENAPSKEMGFYDFFSRRNYNPRCQNNFRYMCSHLREIGFEIPKEPLSAKVMQAESRKGSASAVISRRQTPERD